MSKVLVDLDRTLATYDRWRGETHIGAPIPAMIARIKEHAAKGHVVEVFTARMSDPDPVNREVIAKAIGDWTEEHIGIRLNATCMKDYAVIAIYDDLAVQVRGNKGIFVEDECAEYREALITLYEMVTSDPIKRYIEGVLTRG